MEHTRKSKNATTDKHMNPALEFDELCTKASYTRLYAAIMEDRHVSVPDDCVVRTESVMVRVLNHRERTMVSLYYGIDDNEPTNLREIGEQFAVTGELARQVIHKALYKMRSYEYDLTGDETRTNHLREHTQRNRNGYIRIYAPEWTMRVPISEIEQYVTTHTLNCLFAEGYETLYELLTTPDDVLQKHKGMGEKSLSEIDDIREKVPKDAPAGL